jgi:hypothetical protein
MDTPKTGAEVKAYADKFLAVLERIAVALEKIEVVHDNPLMMLSAAMSAQPPSTPEAGRTPDAAVAAPVAAQGSIPYDEVRKAVMAYGDAKGAQAAKDVLKLFGANYLMDLKARPEKYADVLAALK